MFNIKKKIYVAHDEELTDLMYERSIVLHNRHGKMLTAQYDGMVEDKSHCGILFTHYNLDEMIKTRFDGNVKKFHDFLNDEEDLLIVANAEDYARLYTEMQMELAQDYGISDENVMKMRDNQRLKDFFQGSPAMREFCLAAKPGDSAFDRVCNKNETSYVPTGKLFHNIAQLPFEVIYAMYKWGNISETQANVKIATMAESLLIGQIYNTTDQAKAALSGHPVILQEYLNDDSIKTLNDTINAIHGDNLLTQLFCRTDDVLNLKDADTLSNIKRLCTIIISQDLDFDSQPETDQAELDFFFDLFENKNITTIENAKFNFISTGMIASKQEKFNVGLVMAE